MAEFNDAADNDYSHDKRAVTVMLFGKQQKFKVKDRCWYLWNHCSRDEEKTLTICFSSTVWITFYKLKVLHGTTRKSDWRGCCIMKTKISKENIKVARAWSMK